MNPSREEAVFALALEKPAEKRADFHDGAGHGDLALRHRSKPSSLRMSTRFATLLGDDLTTAARRRSSDAPRLVNLLAVVNTTDPRQARIALPLALARAK